MSHETTSFVHSTVDTAVNITKTVILLRVSIHYPCSRAVNNGVQRGCHFGHRNRGQCLSPVYTIQLVVKPVVKPV